jgi:hypothetical protein
VVEEAGDLFADLRGGERRLAADISRCFHVTWAWRTSNGVTDVSMSRPLWSCLKVRPAAMKSFFTLGPTGRGSPSFLRPIPTSHFLPASGCHAASVASTSALMSACFDKSNE